MLARRVEIGSTTVGRVEPKPGFVPMSCSELDDLLDEILGDQIFRNNNNNNNNVPSQKPPHESTTTRQRNGQPTCNAVQRDNAGTANNGTENHGTKYHDDDVTKTRTTSNTEPYPAVVAVGGSVENCAEFQTRGRTPSLPGNYSPANRYRRLQSVPCNDYYGGTHKDMGGPQSYYERSDQFVHGLCTDEPVAWLDRQKLKLQSRYENRWRWNQSDQQRRLVEELKAAQTMLGFEKQTTQADDEGKGARNSSFQKSQTLGHQRQHGSATGGGVPVQMSDQLHGLDLLLPCARDVIRSDAVRSDAFKGDATRSDAVRSDATRSDAIRSDAIRSDVIRSDAARSDVIRSDAMRSDATRSDVIRSDVIRNDAMRSDAMRSDAIRSDVIRSDAARSDVIRNDAMRSDAMRSDAVRSDTIRSDVIRNDAMRSDAMRSDVIRSDVIRNDAMRSDANRSDVIRSDAIRSDATRSDAMRSDVIRSDVIRSDATRSDATRSDAIRNDAVRSDAVRSDAASCKSERNYYISGAEMPPFTTHQTKYVFSVSSPHSSSSSSVRVNPSDVIQKVPHDPPQVNARPGPPTPKRVSSRDALRHSYVHDWRLEQWEQGSYTSLSSKSDVPETSSVAADKRNEAADTRQRTSNSSGCAEDQSGIYDALDVSRTRFHGINNPAVSYRDLQGCVEGNTGPMAANGTGKMVQISGLNGSSTSGTSSLSINSASQSAFEPLQQCSGDGQQGKNYATSFSADSANPFSPSNPDPVSASRNKTSSHPGTDLLLQHSASDFALGRGGFSRNSQNLTENSSSIYRVQEKKPHSRLPSNSSSFPPDLPFPPAVSPSATKSQPNVSTMSLLDKSLSLKKCEDSHDQATNSAGARQLPVSPEQQPPGNDVMEVISLQLIGPGMQKLEPEGDLPAVRPVTPKCPQPGIGMGASNSLKSRPKSLGSQRHASSGDNPHPGSAVHQKFDPGPRRATIYDHTLVAVDFGKEQDICNREQRAELADALNGEDQTKQRVKHRRHTTASGHDLLLLRPAAQQHRRPGGSSDGETAFRRTERLLSADFTAAQGQRSLLLGRRGSASPPSTETGEGTDDVFGTAKSSGTGRRGSRASGQREREVNLAMLDSAVAGLRASASSPVEGSSSSNTVVQLPPPGKATPGLNPGRDPLSPRASIHTLSNGAVTSSSSNNSTDTTIRTNHAPRFVRDSSRHWHKPNISRDEAINSLKDMAPGTFLIRNSNSFPGAFGLALKVAHLPPNVHSRGGDPKAELVRHFLIEPTSKGVKLKGCNSEPVFGSLAALVYQHSLTALSLPCKLIIPDPSSARKRDDTNSAKSDVTTSEALLLGATCNVLYINSVDMESLTGNEAIDKAVSATFATTPTPLTTVVQLKVSSQGVTLTDVNRKLFFRRHYPVDTVTFAGIDPEMRSWIWTNDETKSAHKSSVFGFVARKQGSPMDNACHVFAELDRDQPGDAIVDFIMKVMLGQG